MKLPDEIMEEMEMVPYRIKIEKAKYNEDGTKAIKSTLTLIFNPEPAEPFQNKPAGNWITEIVIYKEDRIVLTHLKVCPNKIQAIKEWEELCSDYLAIDERPTKGEE